MRESADCRRRRSKAKTVSGKRGVAGAASRRSHENQSIQSSRERSMSVVKKLLLLLCVLSFSVGAQTIKIGELNSYKVFPAFLEPYKKGMELAVEQINATGGVQGKKIELISRDDGGTPGDAVRVAEELLSREGVTLLTGTFASNVGLAVAD